MLRNSGERSKNVANLRTGRTGGTPDRASGAIMVHAGVGLAESGVGYLLPHVYALNRTGGRCRSSLLNAFQ